MAGVAKLRFFLDKQFLVLSSMSHMAGKTFPFGRGWFVGHCRRSSFVGMTAKAEFSALLCKEGRILRSMGIMTSPALSPLERKMFDITTCL